MSVAPSFEDNLNNMDNYFTIMEEEMKKIREHIGRSVTQLAREHGVEDAVVWRQMLIAAAEYCYMNDDEIYFKP